MQWLTIERHNRTRTSCQVCIQFCFVRRLLVLLPNFVVIVEHIKFWGNHSFWPSNITDIDRDGWNITCRWCQDSYIFPQCCALRENIIPWENISLLAVHRNVIFHDRLSVNICIILDLNLLWSPPTEHNFVFRHTRAGFTNMFYSKFNKLGNKFDTWVTLLKAHTWFCDIKKTNLFQKTF